MNLHKFSILIRSIIAIALIIVYNLRNIMPNPFKYILNTPIFYIFVLFLISYLVTMNPTTSLAIAILISILTISNKTTPLTGLSESFQDMQAVNEAVKSAIEETQPFRQDVAEASVGDVIKSFSPNVRVFINSPAFEIPNEVEQQKRVVDYCNEEINNEKGICKWFSSLMADSTRPEVAPVTTETRLNEIFRTVDTPMTTNMGVAITGNEGMAATNTMNVATNTMNVAIPATNTTNVAIPATNTTNVAIPETFYNFDMGCEGCGVGTKSKGDCPLTLRKLAMGNIESANGVESEFTSSYAPVSF